nr:MULTISPECIES: hypothetical protein [Fischerella]
MPFAPPVIRNVDNRADTESGGGLRVSALVALRVADDPSFSGAHRAGELFGHILGEAERSQELRHVRRVPAIFYRYRFAPFVNVGEGEAVEPQMRCQPLTDAFHNCFFGSKARRIFGDLGEKSKIRFRAFAIADILINSGNSPLVWLTHFKHVEAIPSIKRRGVKLLAFTNARFRHSAKGFKPTRFKVGVNLQSSSSDEFGSRHLHRCRICF